jgi:Tfp pilus assembly protein PilE
MGQQQLLLIVLGVIVVGIAIVVGINLFNSNAVESNRNAIVADLNNVAAKAMQYYKTPTAMGGGGNSFVGYALPTGMGNNANGTLSISTAGTATTIVFTGVGTEKGDNGSSEISYTCTITPADTNPIQIAKVN